MDNNESPVRRLTKSLAGTAQQLLRCFRGTQEQTDRPLAKAGNTAATEEDTLALKRRRQSFSSEFFAELLIELPGYQREISRAYQAGDRHSLRSQVHQLLGAVAYCDAPELEMALRELHRAIMTTDPADIDTCYTRAFGAISSTLTYSGYRGST